MGTVRAFRRMSSYSYSNSNGLRRYSSMSVT
nr:MAG TPA: hypothetical protein [Caudoviricetes sp.]DAS13844.1 MAG TPA: hypothetical protein [Caudoviricetes sp.]